MNLREVIKRINGRLPVELVADHDNVGLIVGNHDDECEKMIIAYELNGKVLAEALKSECNLVVTYHTPLFRPAKSITSSHSNPEPLFEAIRSGINVFTIHTALDVIEDGLNFDLASRLGLKNLQFLSPLKDTLYKIAVFVPNTHVEKVRKAMADAGGGRIGDYSECSFSSEGRGSFMPGEEASPFIGRAGKLENVDEIRLEMVVEKSLAGHVVQEMMNAHPYEEVAYDIYPLLNESANYGFGAVGYLDEPVQLRTFVGKLKEVVRLDFARASHLPDREVKKVALCAGSGVPFYRDAVRNEADVFITGDVKHHDFREAQSRQTVLIDATHQCTESFATEVIYKILNDLFKNKVNVGLSKEGHENTITI